MVVGIIGGVWVTLHNAHLKEFPECQFHNSSANLVAQLLRIASILKILHFYSRQELRS